MNAKSVLAGAAAGAAFSLFSATPVVSNVGMEQNTKGVATITYLLSSADAVVTLDIQTNATGGAWASIGGVAVSSATGDVLQKVEQGPGKITWDGATNWADGKIPSNGIRAVVTAWSLDNTPDYMVVDISAGAQPNTQRYYPAADFVPGGVSSVLYKTTTLLMRKIMAKDVTWTMGSTSAETQRMAAREGTHQVTLTNNYYIGVYPITYSQWGVVATNSTAAGYYTTEPAMRPRDCVCYNEIRLKANSNTAATAAEIANYSWPRDPHPSSFLGLLRLKTGIATFDLPSEAQWEFAARAGNGVGYWGDGSAIKNAETDENLELLGRYKNNGGQTAAPTSEVTSGTAIVGTYLPNNWGVYDMQGNVHEWCLDWYEEGLDQLKDANGENYGGRVDIDPSNPANYLSGEAVPSDRDRVIRGGSRADTADKCRPAFRGSYRPDLRFSTGGFRVVCTAGLK